MDMQTSFKFVELLYSDAPEQVTLVPTENGVYASRVPVDNGCDMFDALITNDL